METFGVLDKDREREARGEAGDFERERVDPAIILYARGSDDESDDEGVLLIFDKKNQDFVILSTIRKGRDSNRGLG